MAYPRLCKDECALTVMRTGDLGHPHSAEIWGHPATKCIRTMSRQGPWKSCAVLEPHSDDVRIGPGRSPCSSTSSGPTRRRPTPDLQHKVLLVVGRMPFGATEQEAAVAEILRPWCG